MTQQIKLTRRNVETVRQMSAHGWAEEWAQGLDASTASKFHANLDALRVGWNTVQICTAQFVVRVCGEIAGVR